MVLLISLKLVFSIFICPVYVLSGAHVFIFIFSRFTAWSLICLFVVMLGLIGLVAICFQLMCLGVLIQMWISEPVCLALNLPLCDLEQTNLLVFHFPYLFIEYNDCTCLIKVIVKIQLATLKCSPTFSPFEASLDIPLAITGGKRSC